jgi:hypothetical protein
MTTTRAIQERLKELGLYTAKVDGISGKATIAAIRGFQRLHGLKPDGIAGALTKAELFPAPMPERDTDDGHDLPPHDHNYPWPRQRDVERFFGPVGSNQTMLELPFPMRLAWDTRQLVRRFSIHEKVHDSAKRCFDRIADAYDAEGRKLTGIELFGGCLNVRKMRGGSSWSMHAYGVAIDFDPARNQLRWGRDKARLAQPDCRRFWQIWEDEGWVSLGRARNYDWMHTQAARL